jgi:glutamate dehydrogenase (NADP+)
MPYILDHRKYYDANILERLTEPDRTVSFRVCWEDDEGNVRTNRGYRIQFSNAIGPYKGGIRFHKSVNLAVLKFLGFEQIFKCSLTTLPLGGAKGGSDFNPKGKSDREIMRFCQAFMTCLHRYLGPNLDIPAGDIGVGPREIGYMYGQYKRIEMEHTGVLTGKGVGYGGSLIRTEATGYGIIYFAEEMLNRIGDTMKGKVCVISGSGNVAQYTAQRAVQVGAKVVTLSDSSGFIYDPDGLNPEKIQFVIDLKKDRNRRIKEYAEKYNAQYYPGKKPWGIVCDAVFPCATENEIEEDDARCIVQNGCRLVCEGANMPTTPAAIQLFRERGVIFGPSKAVNAGGVAVSGLEMTQNSMHMYWTWDELDRQLRNIMKNIHAQCIQYGSDGDGADYVKGANIAAFVKVADAMLAYGTV